ncbi:hypothetical protein B0H10DRAFT_2017189 [Mycena sp. CBHHK59/15]|nr:hypothetical protein B0H10DRAFT_2017189 [Mycena sp. CBHHK59/15]
MLPTSLNSFNSAYEQLDALPHRRQFRCSYVNGFLIVQCMPLRAHELAHSTLCRWITSEVDVQSGTPFGGLLTFGSTTYKFPHGSKESDSSIAPSENNPGQLPSIIIECGLSESYVHVREKAKGWLNDCTYVQLVIVVKIYVATKRFVIELWTRDVTTQLPFIMSTSTLVANSPSPFLSIPMTLVFPHGRPQWAQGVANFIIPAVNMDAYRDMLLTLL